MPSRENRVYRQRKPIRTALTILFVSVVALALLAVLVFFSFRKYIVYSDEGVRLDVPWLQETSETAQN